MGDFAGLLDVLSSLGDESAMDPAELRLYLDSFRESFLQFLKFKGPNQESRQQLENLLVTTPLRGQVRVDAEPDKRLALQMSHALNLDEALCVQYLVLALEQRGFFNAESAAGLYLEERQVAARCLMMLLSEVVQDITYPQAAIRSVYSSTLLDFVQSLVQERGGSDAAGGSKPPPVLVSRLVELLKDASLEVHPSSDLQQVADEAGLPVSRAQLLQLERRMTVKSLLYCLILDQRAGPGVTGAILDLLVTHVTRARPGSATDPYHQEVGQLLQLCLVLCLTPQVDRGAQELQELQALVGSADLRAKVFPQGSRPPGVSPYSPEAQAHQAPPAGLATAYAVLRLCWGVLLVAANGGPVARLPNAAGQLEEAKKLLSESAAAATFSQLKQFLGGALFSQDQEVHQEVVAWVVYHLMAQALQADSKVDMPLMKALQNRLSLSVKRMGGGMLAWAPLPPGDPAGLADHMGSLMSVLAKVLRVSPRLWLAPSGYADTEVLENLVTRTVKHDAMKVSPEVRVSFYELMTSLAAGDFGVVRVLRQFGAMSVDPSLEVLTWRKLFATMVEYCVRYNNVLDEMARANQAGGVPALMLRGQEERLMNPQEAGILVAALSLFRRIIEEGPLGEVRSFLDSLQKDVAPLLSSHTLIEPLFQLMCHPVPNTVKAALDHVLAAMAHRFPETIAPWLLDRLSQSAVVTVGAPMVPGMPRLDLVTQLNEVEARKEEYPETLAFINLINSLIAAGLIRDTDQAAAGAQAAGNGGLSLSQFTGFVVQHVLAHLWHRGYRFPVQKWELASAALQHLELMMELAVKSGTPPAAPGSPQAPGWAIMHDVLGSGPTLQALLHVLAPGFEDINTATLLPSIDESHANNTNNTGLGPGGATLDGQPAPDTLDPLAARQAAVLAALRVVNKVLQLDQQFAADIQQAAPLVRYQTLEQLLQSGLSGRGAGALANAVLSGLGVSASHGQLLAILLLYVCYQDSVEIQTEALWLAIELSARIPSLVELLQEPGDAMQTSSITSAAMLRRGVAVALRESLFSADTHDDISDALRSERKLTGLPMGPAAPKRPDLRAALVLKLLLNNVDNPALPSMAHLLMGYDCEPSMPGVEDRMLLPTSEYSCLTVIEKGLVHRDCSLSASKPQLYAAMLCLLHRLATHPPSSAIMVQHLSRVERGLEGYEPNLVVQLRAVLLRQPPPPDKVMEAAASLHQKSWILRLQALLLLRNESPILTGQLLEYLLLPLIHMLPELSVSGAADSISGSTLLALLNSFSSIHLQEPNLADLPAEVRRLQADMAVADVSIEALLTQQHVQASLNLHMQSETGDVLFDLPRLYGLLMQRYENYKQRTGQPASGAAGDSATEAVRSTLVYVQQCNAYALLSGAQLSACEGWLQLSEVIFTRHYNLLREVVTNTSPAEALYEVLVSSLQATHSLLSRPQTHHTHGLAAILIHVSRILLSKLQELGTVNVSLGQTSDPLLLVRTPARCHALVRMLLELLELARRAPEVRIQLYAGLLQYLQFCRGSKMSSCAPVVLQALLRSGASSGSGVPALTDGTTDGSVSRQLFSSAAEGVAHLDQGAAVLVARLDATQDAIEKGNAALVNAQGRVLVDVVARDALDAAGPQLQQAVALQLLAALVAVSADSSADVSSPDPSTSLAGVLHQQAVPQALLQVVANVPQTLLVNPTRSSKRGVLVLEAQLALLLALAQAGLSPKARQMSAQWLFSLQPLQYLTSCRGIDLEPEEPGSTQINRHSSQSDSLRQRLQHLLPPILRLVLSLVAALPESTSVRQDARMFVAAHYRALDRILREAASSGTAGWAPGESDLEQAELVTNLLSRLVPVWDELGPVNGEGLRAALYRLASTFCCLDTKTMSPIIRSLHTNTNLAASNGAAGSAPASNRSSLLSRAMRVASVRAALARYLRDTVAHAPAVPATPTAPGAGALATPSQLYGSSGVPFRCAGSSGRAELDPYACRPTLLLIRDMAEQACLDAAEALEELEDLLGLLRLPDSQLDDRTCVQKLLDYGPPGGLAATSSVSEEEAQPAVLGGGLHARRKLVRHYLALAASQLDALLGRSLFVIENSLAVIVLHFLRYLPRALPDTAPLPGGLTGQGGGTEELLMAAAASNMDVGAEGGPNLLGSQSELMYLATRLQETCLKAEELLANSSNLGMNNTNEGVAGRHLERLQGIDLMVRTVKSYCARL